MLLSSEGARSLREAEARLPLARRLDPDRSRCVAPSAAVKLTGRDRYRYGVGCPRRAEPMATRAAEGRVRRLGGYLAVLIGGVGAFAGLSGALTFLPFRVRDGLSLSEAQALTAISAIASVLSVAGAVAGWYLIDGRARARAVCLGVAGACVVAVAAFAALMPASSPSPVPGGPGPLVMLAVVALAYGVEALLLLVGPRFDRGNGVRSAPV